MRPAIDAPENVRSLLIAYPGLQLKGARLSGGDQYIFVRRDRDDDITPPTTLPSVAINDGLYFLLLSDAELPEGWSHTPFLDDIDDASPFIPVDNSWPEKDAEIIEDIGQYECAVDEAKRKREAIELLASEQSPHADLFAITKPIAETAPTLIEGLIRERGVSVVFGNPDEFKTTLVLDWAAHIALGVPWQGRPVAARPVIWYALEGDDEIPVRLRALETRLRRKNPAWGNFPMPVVVRSRIPDSYRAWRAEVSDIARRLEGVYDARRTLNGLPRECGRYPDVALADGTLPVIVIDTLSIALGGEDEKGPRAAGFIADCLDLTKERPDMAPPKGKREFAEWKAQHPGENDELNLPVASHAIIIHHQTKTGTDFAGHRAIGANTHGLYHVRRYGKMTDANRPLSGQITTWRAKDVHPKPMPIRFDVEVVTVEGTKRTAAMIKDRATAISERLVPLVSALRDEFDDNAEVETSELNTCFDGMSQAKTDNARRQYRKRSREELVQAGVLEPIEDANGKVARYCFRDPGPP